MDRATVKLVVDTLLIISFVPLLLTGTYLLLFGYDPLVAFLHRTAAPFFVIFSILHVAVNIKSYVALLRSKIRKRV